ncbi:MAG: HEPN domain-containing protein [Vicinamibacteria bacterium]
MPPRLRDAGSPEEWLRHARSNLARCRADRSLPDVLLEDLCFDAQQAAEKAVKAVLVHKRKRFPKTHDLAELLDLVAKTGINVPADVAEAKRLTTWAVTGRYPGASEEASEDDHREALEVAERTVAWSTALVRAGS